MNHFSALPGNPIYRRELRRAGNLDVLLWLVCVISIVASLGSAIAVALAGTDGSPRGDSGLIPFFVGMAVVALNVGFVPGLAATCLSGERASGTGVQLLLTPYPRGGILLGKLAPRLAPFGAQTCANMASAILIPVFLLPSQTPVGERVFLAGLGAGIPLASFMLSAGLSVYMGLWAPARAAGVGLAYACTVLSGILFPITLTFAGSLTSYFLGPTMTMALITTALLLLPTAAGWFLFRSACEGLEDYLAGENS